jgi:hypothetical protein
MDRQYALWANALCHLVYERVVVRLDGTGLQFAFVPQRGHSLDLSAGHAAARLIEAAPDDNYLAYEWPGPAIALGGRLS